MTRLGGGWPIVIGGALVVLVAGCTTRQAEVTPRVSEKTFALAPATSSLRIGSLEGTLTQSKIVERVNDDTGEVVYGPRFQASLKLRNSSSDEAVRLVTGKIEYLDVHGQPVALTRSSQDTSFGFSSYETDRIDPGAETSRDLDVPFPEAGLKKQLLGDVRVDLTYVPIPYRTGSADVAVSLPR